MAGVKKVELIEGNTLAVTDCGQTEPTLYEIDCGCDDGPGVPPPVQGETTPCNVANYVATQVLSWFNKFIPAMYAAGTSNAGALIQSGATNIGLPTYAWQFGQWLNNIYIRGEINQVITQYSAYGTKNADLTCWLLGCLPATGEITQSSIDCWRAKITAGKTLRPAYAAFLEAVYGFTSIIPLDRWKTEAWNGSTITGTCTGCTSGACSDGIWADFRHSDQDQGWVGYSGPASIFPFPSNWNASGRTFTTARTYRGWEAPACNAGQSCLGAAVTHEFASPIRLCSVKGWGTLWLNGSQGIGEENMHNGNTRLVALFYQTTANTTWQLLASKQWSINHGETNEGKDGTQQSVPPGVYATAGWESVVAAGVEPIDNVTKLAYTFFGGGSTGSVLAVNFNNNPLESADFPTITGAPFVKKPVVSLPANVTQAGFDAIFSVESAGRIYEFEGTMDNLLIIPRAGDTLRPKFGKIATFDGSQTLTNWTLSGGFYQCPYARTIVKVTSVGGYTIANNASYPRAGWNIAVFRDGVPLRHVSGTVGMIDDTTYYYDDVAGIVYLYANPAGHEIRVAHTRNAVKFQANNITLENLIFQRYASVVQEGAITTPDVDVVEGINLLGVQVNWSTGTGARVGAEKAIVQECDFSDNGQLGLSYGGSSAKPAKNPRILSNTAHRNNWQVTNPNFEAQGIKGTYAEDVINDGNETNDGIGKGNWTDLWIRRLLFIRNIARRNTGINLFIERTIDFQVQDCIAADGISNGQSQPQNGQIVISNSQAIDYAACYVRGSVAIHPVAVGSNAAGGIGVQQTAGDSVAPNYEGVTDITRKIIVEDCDIYYRTPLYGRSGEYYSNAAANVGDRDTFYAAGNVIRRDNRHHGDSTGSHFQTNKAYPSGASNQTFAQYQATGMETDSTFDAATVPSELE